MFEHSMQHSITPDGLEIIIFHLDGSAWCTQSGYARFSGLSQQAISKRCSQFSLASMLNIGVDTTLVVPTNTLVETQLRLPGADTRLKTVVLIPASIVGRWTVLDRPELADRMLEAGATQFLYQMAGYKLKVAPTETKQDQQLPPKRDAIDYAKAIEICQNTESAILKSLLQQRIAEELSSSQLRLPESKVEPAICILTVRAEQLGVPRQLIGGGGDLGRYVKRHYLQRYGKKPLGQAQHGKYAVNEYPICPEIDELILEWRDIKVN